MTAPQLCRQCGTMVRGDLGDCPECGASLGITAQADLIDADEGSISEPANAANMAGWKKGCLWILGIFFGLAFLGALLGDETGGEDEQIEAMEDVSVNENGDDAEETSAASMLVPEAVERTPPLTGGAFQARRSAENYLEMTGFSREGLIQQLSSSAGEGYDRADATAAVDSLNVDWNEQAARSAREYLAMMGFSCSGMVEQLSSDAGEGYTVEQARYGAAQAGAC